MIYNFEDLSFQPLTIDRFIHKKGFYEVKERPYAALSFRVSGSGTFEVQNKKFVTKPGDVLFIPADTSYKVEYSVSESIVVHLRHCNYYEAENICFENRSVINVMFQSMMETWNKEHSVNQAKSDMYAILEKIAKDKKISIENSAFANCVRYIESNFCDPSLDIMKVCEIGFISSSSLQRFFLQYFGMSPKQYLIKLRMNKALTFLVENELSVKETAFSCGFSDEKYFSRAFKKHFGYSPSQLRNHIVE